MRPVIQSKPVAAAAPAAFDRANCRATIRRRPEVEKRTGLSRSAIYAMMDRDEFPSAIPLTAKAVGWLESSVESWIASRATLVIEQGGHP